MRSFDAGTAAGSHLDYREYRALDAIERLGPVSLKQIAGLLAAPKTTLHYMLNKLVGAGYAERATGSRRGTPVFTISPAGRRAVEGAALALLRAPFAQALVAMPEAEVEQCLQAVRSVWERCGAGEVNRALAAEATLIGAGQAEWLRRQPPPGAAPAP